MRLDEAEFLIALVLEDLSEERHVVVLLQVGLDPVDDGDRPLNDQILQTVLLIKVGVHVLLHGLPRLLEGLAFLVEFNLGRVDVIDYIFQLLKGEVARGCQT